MSLNNIKLELHDEVRLVMDEDGLEGTIENLREHPGHNVMCCLEPKDVEEIHEWSHRVLKAADESEREDVWECWNELKKWINMVQETIKTDPYERDVPGDARVVSLIFKMKQLEDKYRKESYNE